MGHMTQFSEGSIDHPPDKCTASSFILMRMTVLKAVFYMFLHDGTIYHLKCLNYIFLTNNPKRYNVQQIKNALIS